MEKDVMDAVVYKMMIDLDRMADDMTHEQVACVRKAMANLIALRGELTNESN